MSAIRAGICYTGVTMTAAHSVLLRERILHLIYKEMVSEGSRLYAPRLTGMVNKPLATADAAKDGQKDKKKKKKKSSSSSSSSSPSK
eukprot:4761941-Amphidinium_carterae.1